MQRKLTTYGYAKEHGLTVDTVRRHCRNGTIECTHIPGPAHGMYLIEEAAIIKRAKPGRKQGWRKKGNQDVD